MTAVISALVCGSLWAAPATFTVTNDTDAKIVKLFAREKGTTQWNFFSIGSRIAAGSETKLQWNDPDEGECEWEFMAVFADGEKSNVFTVDTCEEHDIVFE